MSTGDTWRLGRRPSLDGLRGVAVLLVVVCHATQAFSPRLLAAGSVGVTMFFTLSGFLITALLLQEHAARGQVSLSRFYLRRVRRLMPALVVFVAAISALGLYLGPRFADPRDAVPSLLYVSNWWPARGDSLMSLNHMWSLAVEEQFYFLWPLALLLLRTPRRVAIAASVGAVVSLGVRMVLWESGAGWERIYYGSDTRADAILIGCAAAAAMVSRRETAAKPKGASLLVAAAAVFGLTTGVLWLVVLPTVVALLTVGVIVTAAQGEYRGLLTSRLLTWTGRRSYGLYLWHMPFVLILPNLLAAPMWATTLAGLGVSLLLTVASWRYVEQPFLSWRIQSTPTLYMASQVQTWPVDTTVERDEPLSCHATSST